MTDTLVVGVDEAQITPPKETPRKGYGPELVRIAEEGLASRPGPGRSTADIEEGMRIERAAWD